MVRYWMLSFRDRGSPQNTTNIPYKFLDNPQPKGHIHLSITSFTDSQSLQTTLKWLQTLCGFPKLEKNVTTSFVLRNNARPVQRPTQAPYCIHASWNAPWCALSRDSRHCCGTEMGGSLLESKMAFNWPLPFCAEVEASRRWPALRGLPSRGLRLISDQKGSIACRRPEKLKLICPIVYCLQ
jgi:hypothetical protein